MPKSEWIINGFDGLEQVFEIPIRPGNSMSDSQVVTPLQRLGATNLEACEIVDASRRQKSPGYRDDFEIDRDFRGAYDLQL
jgi:hypothetical protein